jgi:16S rRNA (guanine1207-N2)-methyltransferase
MGDPLSEVAEEFSSRGMNATRWNRRVIKGASASPWPPSGPFGTVALRLPRAKEELSMALHAAAGALKPNGTVLVYGAKDEGIASVPKVLGELYEGAKAVGVGGHCRVLEAALKEDLPGHRGALSEWREEVGLGHEWLEQPWVSYPGVFAHGHLDPGTRLLLDALPTLPPGARILDYGCGSGIVGAVSLRLYPEVRLELLDVDAVALEAARENVPGARLLLQDGLPPLGGEGYHAILSNPPLHRGKAEEPEMITGLIRGAASVLKRKGFLVLVAQRRISLEEVFGGAFKKVTVLSEGGGFRVWEGREPRRAS